MHRSHKGIKTSLQILLCLIQERPLELDRVFKYAAWDPESRKERKRRDKSLMSVRLLSVACLRGACQSVLFIYLLLLSLTALLSDFFFFPPDFYPPLDPTALLHCSLSSPWHMSHIGWSAMCSLWAEATSLKIQDVLKKALMFRMTSTDFLPAFSRDSDEINWKPQQIASHGSQGNVVIIISRWSQSSFIGIFLPSGLKKLIGSLFFVSTILWRNHSNEAELVLIWDVQRRGWQDSDQE